ncbi:transmembrane protease serine 9-like isoform X3 [Culex pipiens pallens]|uniref:transmembrane protease serine 9-like isoform X3 n=1 Tax=Culex pipiens pallens TaxID=42434 RepID=UPI00195394F0|nr:transmembrane protease serine 9-like isoform X3 [Culex pipiens pallens]
MKLLIVTILLVTTASKSLQKTSPCPTVFSYDEKEDTSETWYGTLRLKTNVPLHGIFIDVIFDGQVFVFGAYFKDVTTKDNLRFHIEDKTYRLNAGETLILKFYVKHSDYGRIPLLRQVRFNGQNVCVDVSTPGPATERTAKPVVVSLQDHPIVYPEYSSQRETRPAIFSEPSNTSNEHSSNRKRPAADHHDPIQDPTIWKKPSSSSTETSTARTIRQPNPSYESSNENVNYGNVRTPASAGSREGAYRTTTDAYYGGDYTQQPARTTTKKSGFFQGDYAFIQNVETSTHYINSYDEDICGTVVPKANPLVTHGAPAQNAQFPWHGALYRSSLTELRYLCGSTLISARFALTAAHCVALEKSLKPVESDSMLLYLGKTNLKKWTGPEQDAKLEQIIIHPDYNYERFFADIALLRLKDDVKFNHFVRPACLWNFDEDYKVMINKVGFVPGWGYTERGLVSEELSFAPMPVVAHETCIWSNRDFFSKVTSNTSFCAGFRNGTSVCNGDSGGGMVFKQSNKWYLRGIVSVSAALQNHVSCDPNHFAVFTDVAKFLRWIRSYM